MSFETPGDGVRCDHCNAYGKPYEYHGQRFSGLHSNRGEQLCPRCLEASVTAEINQPVGWAQVPASHYVAPRCG